MTQPLKLFETMRRPRLLIQAARIGVADYRRETLLRRLFGGGPLPQAGEALAHLLEIEAELDAQRNSGELAYSASAHVEVLIAMMGEARLLRGLRGPREA